jgi:hypothetical protein
MYKVWTEFEKKFIRENASILHDEKLAEKLCELTGRKVTINAVRKQRKLMGIKKNPGRSKCGVVASPFDSVVVKSPVVDVAIPAGLAETPHG